MTLYWDSNPYAYGAIHARVEPSSPSVGGISSTDKVRGYYRTKQVYEGNSSEAAVSAVEKEHTKYMEFMKQYEVSK